MTAVLRAEFLKLVTVPGAFTLVGAQLVLAVAAVAGAALHVSGIGLQAILAHGGFTSLFTLVLGITAVAGEFRYRTITDGFLGTPRRTRLFLAKLLAYTALGAATGVLAAALTVGSAALFLSGSDAGFDWSSPDIVRAFVGIAVWNTLFAALGVALGTIVTNIVGAIAGALAWIAAVEFALGDLLGPIADWLPLAAGQSLGYAPQAPLTQVEGGLALLGYVVVAVGVAMWLNNRRDVT